MLNQCAERRSRIREHLSKKENWLPETSPLLAECTVIFAIVLLVAYRFRRISTPTIAIAVTAPIIPATMYIVAGGSSGPDGLEGVGDGDAVGDGGGVGEGDDVGGGDGDTGVVGEGVWAGAGVGAGESGGVGEGDGVGSGATL